MASEKALKPDELRKAFQGILERLGALEKTVERLAQRITESDLEARARTDYIRSVQTKIDLYSLEMDRTLPKITAAEAQLGRSNAVQDRLWALLGQNAHSIDSLREWIEKQLAEQDGQGA